MAPDDVTDFMPKHAGYFILALEQFEQANGDEHLAAGQSESVDGLGVSEKVELIIVGTLVDLDVGANKPFTDIGHQILRLLIGIEPAVLSGHLRGRVETKGDLLLRAQRHTLNAASDRIFVPLCAEIIGRDRTKGEQNPDE
jgi:hypothetical protein